MTTPNQISTQLFARSQKWLALALAIACALPNGSELAHADYGQTDLERSIAAGRLDSWHNLIQHGLQLDESQKLQQVNRFINRALSYASDQQVWQSKDYWATPSEALSRGQGDCEDYAIAKFFGLTQMGIPSERLRLTYVKDLKHNQAHMVLAYYAPGASQPQLLDSLQDSIEPASARRDLLPVYAFNDQGIYLASSPQRKAKSDSGQIAFWSEVRERALSDGSLNQPLMPRS